MPTADPPHLPRLAFIGLGRMGLPVATRLASRGYAVTATDRRGEMADPARAAGAAWTSTSADAAATAEVVITMLPGVDEVHDTMLATGQVLTHMAPGTTWIDLSSATAEVGDRVIEQARAKDISVLDAPVGGGPEQAASGALQLFVGAGPDTFQHQLPLLAVIADPARIAHMGGNGSGYTTKLLINLLWFGQVVATTETLLLARATGLDLKVLQATLARSAAASDYVRDTIPRLLDGDYLPAFGIDRCYEELANVTAMARAHEVPFSLADLIAETYRRARDVYGNQDGELLAAALLQSEAGVSLHD